MHKPPMIFYPNAYLLLENGEWIIQPSPGQTKVLARFPRIEEGLARMCLWFIQGRE